MGEMKDANVLDVSATSAKNAERRGGNRTGVQRFIKLNDDVGVDSRANKAGCRRYRYDGRGLGRKRYGNEDNGEKG